MSVVKSERSLSECEFFHVAIQLRKEITDLLLRDFGLKDKVRDTVVITKNMSDEDREIIESLLKRYGERKVIEKYPEWIIEFFRENILNTLRDMTYNIVHANSIYPSFESEYYERRKYQDDAVANCELLYQELLYIVSVLPINVNKYKRYVELVEKEIALLKGWRKKDNRLLKYVKGKKEEDEEIEDKNEDNVNSKVKKKNKTK